MLHSFSCDSVSDFVNFTCLSCWIWDLCLNSRLKMHLLKFQIFLKFQFISNKQFSAYQKFNKIVCLSVKKRALPLPTRQPEYVEKSYQKDELSRKSRFENLRTDNNQSVWGQYDENFENPIQPVTCPSISRSCETNIIFIIDVCSCAQEFQSRILRSIHLILNLANDVFISGYAQGKGSTR